MGTLKTNHTPALLESLRSAIVDMDALVDLYLLEAYQYDENSLEREDYRIKAKAVKNRIEKAKAIIKKATS